MSRPNLFSSASHGHAPAHPSGLRQSHSAASYASLADAADTRAGDSPPLSPRSPPPASNETYIPGFDLAGPSNRPETATESTSLLDFREHPAHEGPCNHGTFSPRPMSPTDSVAADSHIYSGSESDGSVPTMDGVLSVEARKKRRSWKKQLASRMKSKKMSTSSVLAKRHGFKDSTLM